MRGNGGPVRAGRSPPMGKGGVRQLRNLGDRCRGAQCRPQAERLHDGAVNAVAMLKADASQPRQDTHIAICHPASLR